MQKVAYKMCSKVNKINKPRFNGVNEVRISFPIGMTRLPARQRTSLRARYTKCDNALVLCSLRAGEIKRYC